MLLCVSFQIRNVVVETAEVAAKILQKGRLARRTTFLPLDKMSAHVISEDVLKSAQKLVGRDKVFRAIDLIEYDNKLQPAMNFLFGGFFVCSDLETANKVAFDPKIKTRCVTLDGDKADPSGELSGGAPSKSGSLLTQIQAVIEASNSLESKMKQLTLSQNKLRELEKIANHYNNLKHKYDMKKQELGE